MNGTLTGNTLRGLLYTLRPGNLLCILLAAALIITAGTLYLGDLAAYHSAEDAPATFTWMLPTPRVWGTLTVLVLLITAKNLDNAARICAGYKNTSFLPLSEADGSDLTRYLVGLLMLGIILVAPPFICHNLGADPRLTSYIDCACALIAYLLLPALRLSYLNERNAGTMLDIPNIAAAISGIGGIRYLVLLALITAATAGIGYAAVQLYQQHLAGEIGTITTTIAAHQHDYSQIPPIHYQNAAIIAGLLAWLLLYTGSAAAWTYPRDDEDDYAETPPPPAPTTAAAVAVAEPAAPVPATDGENSAENPAIADDGLAELPLRLRQKIAAARASAHKQEPQLAKPDEPPRLLRGTVPAEETAAESGADAATGGKQEPQLVPPDAPPRLLRGQKAKNSAIPAAPAGDKNEPHIFPPELGLLKDADTTRMSISEQQTFARILKQADDHFREGEIDAGLALLKPYTSTGHDPAVYFPAYQRSYALQPQDALLHRLMAAAARGSENCYALIQPELKRIDPAELPADIILPLTRQAMKQQQYHTALALTRNFAKNHPDHPHLPDNYYLAALALAHSGEADKALPILQQLHTRYTDHPLAPHIARTLTQLQSGGQA